MDINELRLKRGQIVDQMKTLIDDNPGDKWNDEIESKYNAMDQDQINIKNSIERIEKQEKLDSELNKFSDSPIITSLDGVDSESGLASDEYKNAFLNLCRVGKNNVGKAVQNALQVGTATEGGNIVPTELDSMLVEYLIDHNEFRNYVTVLSTSSDRNIPIETTVGSAAWTAEEAAYNESDSAYGQASLSAYKLTRIIKVSEELVQDSIFDLMGHLAKNFGKAFGTAEETAIVAGTGSAQPTGFVAAASTGVTAAATGAVTADELIELYHSVSRPYRKGAVFTMNDSTAAAVRKLKDSNGQYLWQAGLQVGQPDSLLGKPLIATSAQAAMATGVDAASFGDLSYYYLAERSSRVMQVLSELYAANGQIGYRGYERIDGKLIDTNAIKNLTMA
ncbi:MAG: phage major capsid protein [Planctomycetes bacterium]|nr:phage major capsid protein [Planctomycetota bacterium]